MVNPGHKARGLGLIDVCLFVGPIGAVFGADQKRDIDAFPQGLPATPAFVYLGLFRSPPGEEGEMKGQGEGNSGFALNRRLGEDVVADGLLQGRCLATTHSIGEGEHTLAVEIGKVYQSSLCIWFGGGTSNSKSVGNVRLFLVVFEYVP
ncbi:hypothetical protein F5883DRAFT_596918 [Diaporthe sp. PMI_573]|nr:hypothetical protein F5883DRAFT_596918 [Diaporthaceae sp. PMI_573]